MRFGELQVVHLLITKIEQRGPGAAGNSGRAENRKGDEDARQHGSDLDHTAGEPKRFGPESGGRVGEFHCT
jgi:hypothetical protein